MKVRVTKTHYLAPTGLKTALGFVIIHTKGNGRIKQIRLFEEEYNEKNK